MKGRLFAFIFLFLLSIGSSYGQKPIVWIISDGNDSTLTKPDGSRVTDPDDVVALASYLLMSNHFDTRGVVIASSHHGDILSKAENQAQWAKRYFGEAYKKDLPNLNKHIGGYQEEIPFIESCLKNSGEKFDSNKSYSSLKNYSSVDQLFNLVKKSKDVVNVLCWGTLTEPAIFVKHCKVTGKEALLSKVRFISHWTNSSLHVGTEEHPERVHNYFNDSSAGAYIKNEALNGSILFYECGAIGQYGVVEGAPRGREYYDQFTSSHIGEIFATGNFLSWKGFVDGSDCASFLVLLGNWGVSLNDINSNGTNPQEIELANEKKFFDNSPKIHDELLRRSRVAAGAVSNPITNYNLFPGHGLTDGHTWVENGRLYVIGGHDESWFTNNTWKMDRWEIWSTDNLQDWRYENKIEPIDTYIGDNPNCWAGDIVERDGKYYWYFSNRSTDTGVAVSDSITGTYVDLLQKPLLPSDIISGNPYDPEIVVEDGRYYIIFAAGTYYIAELGDDMMSLKSEPKPISVVDEQGKRVGTQDKSSLFKRDGLFYLVWGENYATSDKLDGPYLYKGEFMKGGHTSIFEWYGQWYVIQENKDLGLFFRGLALKPIYFARNGDIIVPTSDIDYPGGRYKWDFNLNEMGWREISGTNLVWNKRDKSISGEISGNAVIESVTWIMGETEKLSKLTVRLKNNSCAEKMRISIATYNPTKGRFWEEYQIDWDNEFSSVVDLGSSSKGFVEYQIDIPKGALRKNLKAVSVEPAIGAEQGTWEISSIILE